MYVELPSATTFKLHIQFEDEEELYKLHFTLFTQKFAKKERKSRHTVQIQHSRRKTVRHKMR